MSYDLFLYSPELTRDSFERFFKGRAHYESVGWYVNKDTGVYFSFEFSDGEQGEEDVDPETPEALRGPHAGFNLNYYRPHVFGLEAEPEVTAFVTAFGCTIDDPQNDGMGDGVYTPEGFLRGWNTGNAFGYRAMGGSDALVVDDAVIERVWRWNLQREARQSEIGEECFLPRLNWARRKSDGAPIVFATWGEGVRIAIPECATHALLARDPRPGLSSLFRKKSKPETKMIPLRDVAKMAGCEWTEGPDGRVLTAPIELPPPHDVLAAFEGSFPGLEQIATPFTPDLVLDASLVGPRKA